MPLDRAHVTIASRVMLPLYPAFALAIGLSLTLTDKARLLATPSLRYLAGVVPLQWWGVGFLVVAALMGAALASRRRVAYQAGLSVMVAWMVIYAIGNLAAGFHGEASFSAWTWPAFIAAACWASLLSLQSRER